MIAVPNPEDIEHYGRPPEPRSSRVPLIADDEATCPVRVLGTGMGTGVGAYWSRGDVEVHVLHARQHGPVSSAGSAGGAYPNPAWLAAALRERREERRGLLERGVHSTASGLVLLQAPQVQLVVPTRP